MIVVTAPTGNIGSQVLAHLLDSGEPLRVVARDPSKLPAETRRRVEVIEGSHSQQDVVLRAFDGADRVFWLVPGDPRAASAEAAYVDFARPGCDAMQRCGVKQVVGISALGRGWPKEAGHVTATLKMDDLVASTGVAYRALACSSLMENLLRQVVPIRDQGVFFCSSPADFKLPFCATRDAAALSARLLLDRSWSGVEAIPMMGPEDLSGNDMARIMTEVLGKPVRCQEIGTEDLRKTMLGRGASAGMAQAMVEMFVAKNEGMDHLVARPAPNPAPTGFRQWCEMLLKPVVEA
ncbi:NmrA family NAD(P)-binding protein [Dongia sedimenti]|uniref:NAD(P)H-binding protein n=1 Tax=Dongia sedimenti TaxID=3064282 RepID=A0ABU0YQJ9_9PROT|nr:NAD(P)H-binding protein [Rhodospirillaceae bacterium R-7]